MKKSKKRTKRKSTKKPKKRDNREAFIMDHWISSSRLDARYVGDGTIVFRLYQEEMVKDKDSYNYVEQAYFEMDLETVEALVKWVRKS